jgi:hypothetical protein
MAERERSKKKGPSELEDWLRKALIPVEPDPTFIQELRGNLIRVTNSSSISPWMIILVIAMAVLYITSWLGVMVRVLLAVIALFGILRPRLTKLPNKSLSTM